MQTPINQDFDRYRDDFFKGLSKRETLWGALAFIVGVALIGVFFFKLHIPVQIAVFLALPIMALLGINGFYQRNGLSFIQIIGLKLKVKNSKVLVLKCDDPRQEKVKQLDLDIEKEKGAKKNGKKKAKTIQTID